MGFFFFFNQKAPYSGSECVKDFQSKVKFSIPYENRHEENHIWRLNINENMGSSKYDLPACNNAVLLRASPALFSTLQQ